MRPKGDPGQLLLANALFSERLIFADDLVPHEREPVRFLEKLDVIDHPKTNGRLEVSSLGDFGERFHFALVTRVHRERQRERGWITA
jgi:hypothetical protein